MSEIEKSPVVSVQHVSKSWSGNVALTDLDLEIGRGELVSLLGPNGAGKTTAVRMILGLAGPDSGIVRVFGLDPSYPENRHRTGAVLQAARVPETLRVGEHIRIFSSYYMNPMPLERVLEVSGLLHLEKRKFGELSGGEQRRLLYALAICGDPDLIVLDEPTTGLDVETRRAMWDTIRGSIEVGKSVLLTTHYLEEADALADRIIVLDEGRVAAEGTPGRIKEIVGESRIRCVTAIPLERIAAMSGVVTVRRSGHAVEILASSPESVVRALLEGDPGLSELQVSSANLEEAFIAITEKRSEREVA